MLILAATPIGNLEDISFRLKRTLQEAENLYAEDTRQSGKLLKHLEIERKISSFHEHSPPAVLSQISRKLEAGETVAYISDAGMPGISDPGFELVRVAQNLDVEIDVIPGPSAVVNALILSGLPNHAFCFLGFFPTTLEKRKAMIDRLAVLDMTAVFFEGPTRIEKTLSFLNSACPETPVAICREMTKLHQEVLRGRPQEVLERLTSRGEFALVIGPIVRNEKAADPIARYGELLEEGHPPTAAVKILAREMKIPKREVYKIVNS